MAAPIIYYYRLVQLTDRHLTTRPLRDHIGCLRVPGQNQNSDRYDVEIDPINNLRAKSPSSPNQYGMSVYQKLHPKWILIPNGSFAGIENLIDYHDRYCIPLLQNGCTVNNKKATLSICYRITETDLILGLSQITNSTGEQIWELSPNATGSNDHYSIYPIKDTPVIAPLSPSNVRNIQYAHIPELTELNWVPYDVIHVEAAADVFYDKGDFDDFTDRIISLLSTAPEPEEEQFNHTTILNDLSQLHQLKKKDRFAGPR
jgi:hypothetical protein